MIVNKSRNVIIKMIMVTQSRYKTTKQHALAFINDCSKYKMDLATKGVVITDVIRCLNSKMIPLAL
jgi:hypothetical protein